MGEILKLREYEEIIFHKRSLKTFKKTIYVVFLARTVYTLGDGAYLVLLL